MDGFREHIAIDGSLNRVSGLDAAYGWASVKLDFDQEQESWYAIYCRMLAEVDAQRTIKRAGFRASAMSCLRGPAIIHTENIGISDALFERRRWLHWTEAEGC